MRTERDERSRRVGVYVRISEDRNGDQLGVGRQETDCRELVTRRGWTAHDVYKDDDKSAYSGKVRPEYRRLLDDIRAGTIQAVVAWHPDRLHRSPPELEDFIDLVEAHGVAVATVQAGDYDLSTASGRMTARVVGAVARGESEHSAEKIQRKMRELAENGHDHGGPRPRGWQVDRRTLEPAEADAIRTAAARVLAGDSIRSICADLGPSWSPAGLRRILRSARISGRAEHRGRIVAESTAWAPIVDIETSDRLRALLADPARRTPGRPGAYLLTGGVAVCGACGAPLVSHPHGGKRRMECVKGPSFRGCGRVGIAAEPVEDIVTEAVMAAVDSGALAALLKDREDPNLLAELARTETKLAELARDWAEDRLTRGEWEAARGTLVLAQKDATRRLEAGRRRVGLEDLTEALRDRWPALPLARRRIVIKALVDAVIIRPTRRGAGFDPDRIEIHWRGGRMAGYNTR